MINKDGGIKKYKLKKYAKVFFYNGEDSCKSNWILIKYTDLTPTRNIYYDKVIYNFKDNPIIIYRSDLNKKELLVKKVIRNNKKEIYADWKDNDSDHMLFKVYLAPEDGDIRFKASSDSEAILYAVCEE